MLQVWAESWSSSMLSGADVQYEGGTNATTYSTRAEYQRTTSTIRRMW